MPGEQPWFVCRLLFIALGVYIAAAAIILLNLEEYYFEKIPLLLGLLIVVISYIMYTHTALLFRRLL